MTRWGWWGRALFCAALAAAGAGAAYYEITMSQEFWRGLALSEEGKTSLAMSAIALAVFAALFSFSSGIARSSGYKWLSWFTTAVALCFTLYNTSSVMGFQLKERVGRVIVGEQQAARAEKVAVEQRQDAKSTRSESVSWLRATYKTTRDPVERAQLMKRIAETEEKPLPSSVAPTADVLPDVQAQVIAGLLSKTSKADVEWVQVRMIGAFALLLGLGTMFAFWLAGRLWPGPVTVAEVAAKAAAALPTVASAPATVADAAPATSVGKEAAPAHEDAIPFSLPYRQSATAKPRAGRQPITQDERDLVEEFVAEARAAGKPGAQHKAELVHQWFCKWANATGRSGMNMTRFGRILHELEPDVREHSGRFVFYRGLSQPAFAIPVANDRNSIAA